MSPTAESRNRPNRSIMGGAHADLIASTMEAFSTRGDGHTGRRCIWCLPRAVVGETRFATISTGNCSKDEKIKMLSVIVPTRDRAIRLQQALRSLVQQNLPTSNYEIIVVDNGSRDNTRAVVAEFQKMFASVRYIYDASPGLHVGRHRGFSEAKGDILVFVDDDIEAFPTLLSSIKERLENYPKIALVGGKCLPRYEKPAPEWIRAMWAPNDRGERIFWHLSLIDLGDAPKIIDPIHVFGCNFSIRRSVLLAAGGFHPDAFPQSLIQFRGDGETHVWRYIVARGHHAFYDPNASVYHYVPQSRMTLEYLCQRAYNEGISSSYTKLRADHGMDGGVQCAQPESSNSPWARVRRKRPKEIIRALARRLLPVQQQPQTEHLKAIGAAYEAGFAFHQKAVQKSELLRAWVLHRDYWEAQVPSEFALEGRSGDDSREATRCMR
jgi:glycosyltransferase involved in cell wall biosynthesis